MPRSLFLLTSLAGTLLSVADVSAQQVTVQQPEVSVFSLDTVVSVPDGGRALLGALGSGADARNQFGFSPIGSSIGTERFHQAADVSVFIQDLDEMDRQILASGGTELENPWTGEITHQAEMQGAGLAQIYSYRPAGPVGSPAEGPKVNGASEPMTGDQFDPRGTAAFRALRSRYRD